eukprot:4569830-Prymnesium_polylepis.1
MAVPSVARGESIALRSTAGVSSGGSSPSRHSVSSNAAAPGICGEGPSSRGKRVWRVCGVMRARSHLGGGRLQHGLQRTRERGGSVAKRRARGRRPVEQGEVAGTHGHEASGDEGHVGSGGRRGAIGDVCEAAAE